MLLGLIRKRTQITLALIVLIVGGLFALSRLPADLFPNLNYPLLNVITHYPGSGPQDIETIITNPLEAKLAALTGVRRITSLSRPDLSQITVEFDWGTAEKDARQQLNQALSGVASELPSGVVPQIENIGSSLREIMDFGVTVQNNRLDSGQLKYYVQTNIINKLKSIKGIARIQEISGRSPAYLVQADPLELLRHKLNFQQLKEKIKENNVREISGYIDQYFQDYTVRGVSRIKTIEDLKRLPLGNVGGRPVFLREMASVTPGYLPQRYQVHINGQEGLVFAIYKNAGANTLRVAGEVKKKIYELESSFSTNIKLTNIYDQSEIISEAGSNLQSNIIVGIILVIGLLFLFLGSFRNTLLIALSIPITIIISFIFFSGGKLSLNLITLGALAVAVGMVVDDSIIVLENIRRHRGMGKSGLLATVDGTREIMAADISGTLTTVAAFIPFIFLSGIGGRFSAPFGWVMIIVLLVSLLVSLTIIPAWSVGQKEDHSKPPVLNTLVDRLVRFNQNVLSVLLCHKIRAILTVFLIFVMSAIMLLFSPVTFLPEIDEGAILMEYILPPGTSFSESSRIGKKLEQLMTSAPEVQTVYRRTGSETSSYQIEPVNRGELVLRLKPKNQRQRNVFQIIKSLQKTTGTIPGIITMYHQVTAEKMDESLSGISTLFGITLYGEDEDKILEYAQKIETIASRTPGIGTIVNNTKYQVPEIQVVPVPEKMAQYGLSDRSVFDELKLNLAGEIVTNVINGQKVTPIFLKGSLAGNTLENLRNIPIQIPGGAVLPLSAVTKFSTSFRANSIEHINLQREITMPTELDGGNIGGIIRRLNKNFEKLHLPSGYTIEYNGQYHSLLETLKGFVIFSLISVLLVFFIMSLQFGNLIHPLAILVELPFAFTGAFLAIAISRQPVNISFFIGLITLIGISVNNGIVLIDYVNRKRLQGMERNQAIREACQVRTRPILLTSLTAFFALLPVSLGLGIGSKIHQSLAICVMGGLLVNTFLTLNILPLFYSAVEDLFKFNFDRLVPDDGNQ